MPKMTEPLDVDFFFDPTPPTQKELEMISQYIRERKAKLAKQKKRPRAKQKKKPSK